MLPALAGATAAKVLVCFLCYAILLNSPLGGREKLKDMVARATIEALLNPNCTVYPTPCQN
jgi:hypothetical protein